MIDRPPEVHHLAVQLHVHLVEVPAPVAETAHSTYLLTADIAGEHRAEPVPPHPHHLVTNAMPRSNSKSSTLRSESGNRTYIMTASRITSGAELKRRNGLGGSALDLRLIHDRYHPPPHLPRSSDKAHDPVTKTEAEANPECEEDRFQSVPRMHAARGSIAPTRLSGCRYDVMEWRNALLVTRG
jgi:hypothetical protein